MKKLISCLLVLAFAFSLVACSSEAVPFSEKLMNKKECYIDVVEIIPESSVSDAVFLYCKCILADGSIVWMEIFAEDYIKYFDSDAVVEEIFATARKITYDKAVRLNGAAFKYKDTLINPAPKKVFRFGSADESITLKTGNRTSPAVEYTTETKNNTVVYADITRIESKYGFSMFSSTFPSDVVCECKTANGDDIWFFISVDEYKEYLDKNARFKIDVIDPANASVLEFVEPVRFYGITFSTADKVTPTVSSVGLPAQLVEFTEVDRDQVEKAKLSNQNPVKYTGKEAIAQPVYIDITHITPELVLYSHYTIPSALICKCKTSDNETVWAEISIGNYKEHFFEDYADTMQVERSLGTTQRLIGKITEAKSVSSNLPDEIGQDTIIYISEITTAS